MEKKNETTNNTIQIMAILFPTPQENLIGVFKELTINVIQSLFDYKVYQRGAEYYENELIKSATINAEKSQLIAQVQGESDYTVEVALRNGKVTGSCTCPYGNFCKHVAAVLLFAIDDDSLIESEAPQKIVPDKDGYLQSLSKDELVDLVKTYAPQQFWVTIMNSQTNKTNALKTFKNVQQKIEKLFRGGQDLYDIDGFSTALDAQIQKLSGLEKNLKVEIAEMLFFIIHETDQAFEEGYLYDDHDYYGDDYYTPSNVFDEFCQGYIKKLTFEEKIAFFAQLDKELDDQSHDTFTYLRDCAESAFDEKELAKLKDYVVGNYLHITESLMGKYYRLSQSLMDVSEKEPILKHFQSEGQSWVLELVGLYSVQGQWDKAIKTIKGYLAENSGFQVENVYYLYLDILSSAGKDLFKVACEALAKCPTEAMLKKIASLTMENIIEYEQILEHRSVHQFFQYLNNQNRMEEAHALIKGGKIASYGEVFDFYKKYKKSFPQDAETFFKATIYNNLEQAGESFYNIIYQNLLQLRQINSTLSQVIVSEIRLQYKRRSNLMKMLSEF